MKRSMLEIKIEVDMIKYDEKELGLIIKAIKFSADKHSNQRRKDKEATPYINHPIEVVQILWRIGNVRHMPILIGAMLHDVIEDTGTKPDEILTLFGEEILHLVLEVTDDKSLPKAERKRLQIENAPHKSTGAKLINIADKISNVCSQPDWPKERFIEYLDWTEKVMHSLIGTNLELEKYYYAVLEKARVRLEVFIF